MKKHKPAKSIVFDSNEYPHECPECGFFFPYLVWKTTYKDTGEVISYCSNQCKIKGQERRAYNSYERYKLSQERFSNATC